MAELRLLDHLRQPLREQFQQQVLTFPADDRVLPSLNQQRSRLFGPAQWQVAAVTQQYQIVPEPFPARVIQDVQLRLWWQRG